MKEIDYQVPQALPSEFDFYHLGSVHIDESAVIQEDEAFPDESVGVAFSIYPMHETLPESSRFRTLLMAVFDPGLEADIYMEIGNVIASRYAGKLSQILSENVTITPPLFLKSAAVQRLIKMPSHTLTRKRYIHTYSGRNIPIEVWVLKVEDGNIGHA